MRRPSKKILENLARNVKEIRVTHGISQEQLAEKCGFHRTYIGSIERGERNATLSTLEALSESLDVSISRLLDDEELIK
ncbi:helix-turn-helix domain-containing protein [Aeromonas caviae]|uniref:helix-turn-helix domain-containing protein n=1 Tax=Aeromonas veronii TaxID=654 RepID=UPI003A24BC6F